MTKFQQMCKERFGRLPTLKTINNIFKPLKLLLSDCFEMKADVFDIFPYVGALIFKKHVFLNPDIISANISIDLETVKTLIRAGLVSCSEVHPELYELASNKLGIAINDWQLYSIPNIKQSRNFITFLIQKKVNDLSKFEETHQYIKVFNTDTSDLIDIPPVRQGQFNTKDFGLYYISMVPADRISQKEKCWLFK